MRNFHNAAGQKLSKSVAYGDTIKLVNYLDGFQYAGNVLQFFPTAEGYVKATPTDRINSDYHFNYIYNYTDHLDERSQSIALIEVCERSSVRLSYTLDPQTGTLKIVDEHHYYPFGLRHEIHYPSSRNRDFRATEGLNGGQVGDPVELVNVTETEYMYKFGAKEWQDELGLNIYDFEARMYDPTTGRTTTVDPLAEEYYSVSPYSFFGNNPVFFVDPTGMSLEPPPEFNGDSWTDDTGTYTKWEGIDNSYVKDGDTSQVYDSNDQMYYDVAKVTGIAGEAGGIVDSFINSDFWNSDLMRMMVPDVQSIGLSANVSAFLGTGSTPINVTLLTRGESPGLYFTPQVNASVGTGIEANAGIAVSTGLYTGNPREITSSMLEGNSYGVSGGLGFKVDATVGISYSPTGNGTGFIQSNAQIGVGIQGSPSTGVNLQANYQYTPAVIPLIKL